MNKCGFIVAGVFGCIASVILAIVSILLLVGGQVACEQTYYYTADENNCWSAMILLASLGLAASFLWIATAVCVFFFACGSRLANFQSDKLSGDSVVPTVTVITSKSSTSESKNIEQTV
jgi:hypothetical protein